MPTVKRELLTKSRVDGAETRPSAYRIWDAKVPGLALRVLPTGIKTFEVHFGRNQSEKLGRYPTMTLETARTQGLQRLGRFVETGERSNNSKVTTFADFLEHRYEPWVTAERKAGGHTVQNIRAQFGELMDKPLDKISAWDIERFKAARLKAGIAPATVNRDLARIRAALAKAVEWDLLETHPLAKVKRAKGGDEGRIRYLRGDEEKRLRDALEAREAKFRLRRISGSAWRAERGREALPAITGYYDHLAPMTLLALNTGLRRGELTSITWDDINLPSKLLTVRAGYSKSGKARHLPLNSEAIDVLKRYQKQHKAGRLFDVESVKKSWASLMVDAKLSDFRFHDIRHTFASKLVMAGVDLNTVRELLGHADIRMTLRYSHLAPEHKAAAVEKLVR